MTAIRYVDRRYNHSLPVYVTVLLVSSVLTSHWLVVKASSIYSDDAPEEESLTGAGAGSLPDLVNVNDDFLDGESSGMRFKQSGPVAGSSARNIIGKEREGARDKHTTGLNQGIMSDTAVDRIDYLEEKLREDIQRELSEVIELERHLWANLRTLRTKKRRLEVKKRQPFQCLVNVVSCWK